MKTIETMAKTQLRLDQGASEHRRVKTLDMLEPRIYVIGYNREQGVGALYEVLSYPFRDGSKWRLKVVEVKKYGRKRTIEDISLADYSVVPYDEGCWNNENYLLMVS